MPLITRNKFWWVATVSRASCHSLVSMKDKPFFSVASLMAKRKRRIKLKQILFFLVLHMDLLCSDKTIKELQI